MSAIKTNDIILLPLAGIWSPGAFVVGRVIKVSKLYVAIETVLSYGKKTWDVGTRSNIKKSFLIRDKRKIVAGIFKAAY